MCLVLLAATFCCSAYLFYGLGNSNLPLHVETTRRVASRSSRNRQEAGEVGTFNGGNVCSLHPGGERKLVAGEELASSWYADVLALTFVELGHCRLASAPAFPSCGRNGGYSLRTVTPLLGSYSFLFSYQGLGP